MNAMTRIEKINSVLTVQMLVEAGKHDVFLGQAVQTGTLPFIFSYGKRRTLKHRCLNCKLEVAVDFGYGGQVLAGSDLSRQGFHENRILLDAVGNLFEQYLFHEIDVNGFESYLYQTDPDNNKGALLDVAYYRCAHCQAQYLALYQLQLKDERPPFEPDEILISKVYQVALDHEKFMQTFQSLAPEVVR